MKYELKSALVGLALAVGITVVGLVIRKLTADVVPGGLYFSWTEVLVTGSLLGVVIFVFVYWKMKKENQSALQRAADGEVYLLRLLLEAGADVEVRDREGRRPLHLAARTGSAATVQLLLEHGADPESRDNMGKVPQQYAREQGHDEVVVLLVQAARKQGRNDPS